MSSKTILSILGGLLAYQAIALPAPQELDFDVIEALPPAPTPTIASGVLSQAVAVNTASMIASIVQSISTSLPTQTASYDDANDYDDDDYQKAKRAACAPMASSSYKYTTSPDTAEAFLNDTTYSIAANTASTPAGYSLAYQNLNGSTSTYYYLGYSTLSSYDTNACAASCASKTLCQSFNIYFERDPTMGPGEGCNSPLASPSQTLIKCVLWGGPITPASASNIGQYTEQFHVVIAGSNAYVKDQYFVSQAATTGYDAVTYLGNVSINAPLDCNGNSTYMGVRMFNTGPFDPSLCAATCSATSAFDIKQGLPTSSNPDICRFFVTYQLLKNGVPFAQACAMYTETWSTSYAINTGNYDAANNHYTIASSYASSNTTDPGVCHQAATQNL